MAIWPYFVAGTPNPQAWHIRTDRTCDRIVRPQTQGFSQRYLALPPKLSDRSAIKSLLALFVTDGFHARTQCGLHHFYFLLPLVCRLLALLRTGNIMLQHSNNHALNPALANALSVNKILCAASVIHLDLGHGTGSISTTCISAQTVTPCRVS